MFSETAGAAHGAVIAGFAAGFEGAGLFVLKEVDEFGDGRFFNSKTFLTRMARVHPREPWRVKLWWRKFRLNLYQSIL